MMNSDTTLDTIRNARKKISTAVDHDPQKLVAYYQQLQKRHVKKLVRTCYQDAHIATSNSDEFLQSNSIR